MNTPTPKPDAAPELLPCPFCGGQATIRASPHDAVFFVKCVPCHACSTTGNTRNDVIAAWNRRPTPAPPNTVPDAAERAAKAIADDMTWVYHNDKEDRIRIMAKTIRAELAKDAPPECEHNFSGISLGKVVMDLETGEVLPVDVEGEVYKIIDIDFVNRTVTEREPDKDAGAVEQKWMRDAARRCVESLETRGRLTNPVADQHDWCVDIAFEAISRMIEPAPTPPKDVARPTTDAPASVPAQGQRAGMRDCTYCNKRLFDWVDPDWSSGPICRECETKHQPAEFVTAPTPPTDAAREAAGEIARFSHAPAWYRDSPEFMEWLEQRYAEMISRHFPARYREEDVEKLVAAARKSYRKIAIERDDNDYLDAVAAHDCCDELDAALKPFKEIADAK